MTVPPEWEELNRDIRHCTRCPLCRTRTRSVAGEGSVHARIMFVGEAPGAQEDAQGRPFVGPAGNLLSELLDEVGIPREDVFITNVLKCRPPDNRDPADYEIEKCIPYLRRQVSLMRPPIICTLGNAAYRSLVDASASISRVRGQFFQKGRFSFFATYHPAAALHSQGQGIRDSLGRDFATLAKKWRSGHGNHDQP